MSQVKMGCYHYYYYYYEEGERAEEDIKAAREIN